MADLMRFLSRMALTAGLLLAASQSCALAQAISCPNQQFVGVGPALITQACAVYQGPLDAVASATACYSLRGCSAAYAAPGTNSAVVVRRASDSTTANIHILPSGDLDTASAATFAGTDATASCSTTGSSVTLACTGASSTPLVGDEIFGVGISHPAYLTACGTFTGGADSCTMNIAQNIGAAETVTFQVALFIRTWFDQTRGNNCATLTCDLGQGASANQFLLVTKCLGSAANLPCAAILTTGTPTMTSATTFTPATGVATLLSLGERPTGAATAAILRANGATGSRLGTAAGANTWSLTGGTSGTISPTASDGAPHAGVAVVTGAATSCYYIDNTPTPAGCTGTTVVGNTTAGTVVVSISTGGFLHGELMFYDNVAFSASQVAAMHTNQAAYWGTP